MVCGYFVIRTRMIDKVGEFLGLYQKSALEVSKILTVFAVAQTLRLQSQMVFLTHINIISS